MKRIKKTFPIGTKAQSPARADAATASLNEPMQRGIQSGSERAADSQQAARPEVADVTSGSNFPHDASGSTPGAEYVNTQSAASVGSKANRENRGNAHTISPFKLLGEFLESKSKAEIPECKTFKEFLLKHAKVLQRDGTGGKYSLEGRAPLELIIDWIDKIIRNCLDGETVEIDGVVFQPGQLKGASIAVAGGAQWGKTILELNLMAYGTAVRFISIGCYLPDGPKVKDIVGQKFRPNVLDLYPWMADMIQLGKTENASGKTIDREESYMVTDGERKAFGNFCGMHKPPTSITLDAAALDEVDDIKDENIGFVDGRMTNSPLKLIMFIGTQRIAGSGQNARLKASSFHIKMTPCTGCGAEWNIEENFPRIVRISETGEPDPRDPIITAEMGHNRRALYYCACPECGTELDRDAGCYRAKHPERVAQAKLGVRVSQFNISAISIDEIVGAWYAAMEDVTGQALVAWWCDRAAIPNAGAAQPITQTVLDTIRELGTGLEEGPEPYAMSLTRGTSPRVAGMDMGPRCWFWCDEVVNPFASACVWSELITSGNAPIRVPLLMEALGIDCIFFDAGGEPDLTKRLVLALNGLEGYVPPQIPQRELVKSYLSNLGVGLTWDGTKGKWINIRAAAVLFTASEAKGVEQTVGFTQEGLIYPLIKCNRSESIQTAVNDFLTPGSGVLEFVGPEGKKVIRQLPRARLPQTYIGPGVSQALLDGHLLNLRKERDPRTGEEDWVDKVENHLGLAKVYARMAALNSFRTKPVAFAYQSIPRRGGSLASRTKGLL